MLLNLGTFVRTGRKHPSRKAQPCGPMLREWSRARISASTNSEPVPLCSEQPVRLYTVTMDSGEQKNQKAIEHLLRSLPLLLRILSS